ncbi:MULTISPECIES: nucleotide sugar dehydrogenase [Microbacterium]|uniref:nucleotide sugar dehydrogenase n=1 Tax=Microbacterium TaxID=33882 RepID=UPI002784A77E|nr:MULTISPECIES: nucleotide sugar dehydrogenase [Microbacterium]MDQ1084401.1 UDP-N-acetyl-D-glucosamine dehydrogenase [Microbacterium sp. SORGH_AS_0344]MDQ1170325.1 UDP-N-acetyl-D-glucosamine dehydrogenase [Microbacterium proteolyticum]
MTTLDVRADMFDAPLPPMPADAPFDFDVAIVGLGYVGLPTALAYHASGSRVLALDASSRRLRTIAARGADLIGSDRERLDAALRAPAGFRLTGDVRELARAAAVVVCVPTPVDDRQVPDLVALRAACATVVAAARPGQLVMLTSTTYVGCTRDLVEKPLQDRGLRIGQDVFVTFSAERIDPGNVGFAQEVVPRVVGGATPQCEEEGARLLSRYAAQVHRVSSLATAEMTKLLENTFRAVNIALANEFADICGALDVPVTEVIEAASTKPYGFMAFYPGPGVGGHCIPCDPHYLLWQLKALHVDAGVITEAMTRIAARPRRVVERIRDVLGRAGKSTLNARILVVGVAYKPDVADLRESPALEIIDLLIDLGAEVQFVDTHAPRIRLASGRERESLTDPAAFRADVVLVHTRHHDSDLGWLDGNTVVVDGTYRSGDIAGRVLL